MKAEEIFKRIRKEHPYIEDVNSFIRDHDRMSVMQLYSDKYELQSQLDHLKMMLFKYGYDADLILLAFNNDIKKKKETK